MEGHSNDEIKEMLLTKAGVNAVLLHNPVSRNALFKELEYMYPFKIEDKITISKSWMVIYGYKYDSISLIDLFVSKIKGDAIDGSFTFKEWNITENGDVELSHKTALSQSKKNDWYNGEDTIKYSLDGENVCITDIYNHKQFRKNNALEQLALAEDYTRKNIKVFNTNGIQLKWEQEKIQYLSTRFNWLEDREHYDSKEINEAIKIRRRNITVSRDDNDLSTAIVEFSDPKKSISIDLTNSEKDISTLDAARDIINNNEVDRNLWFKQNEASEVKRERLARKINESKFTEGCKKYGDLQKVEENNKILE